MDERSVQKWVELFESKLNDIIETVRIADDGFEESIESQVQMIINEDLELLRSQVASNDNDNTDPTYTPVAWRNESGAWHYCMRKLKELNHTDLHTDAQNKLMELIMQDIRIASDSRTMLVIEKIVYGADLHKQITALKKMTGQKNLFDEIEELKPNTH